MRKLFVVLFFILLGKWAQAQQLERIEPMFWWVGMNNPKLQLLVHGTGIAALDVQLEHPGVKLAKVHKVENPNYLFLDLEIDRDAKAGKFPIVFNKEGKKKLQYTYELKKRESNRIQGLSSKDLIYLLMPDRFANGEPGNDVVKGMRENKLNRDSMYYRHGGDLQGLIGKLDYLEDLGVTAIWMTPEIENDMTEASYHGYAATDHYKIDPRYGSLALYKKYVDKAHEKGFKIVKDIVHNHMGTGHWLYSDMPMKSWVNQWPVYTQTSYRDEPVMDPHAAEADKNKMLNGWFVPVMPDFNQKNPFVQNYLTQTNIWWIEYAGIDGLRLDTYPYNDPEYMKDWIQKIKAEFPALSVFGETLVNSVAAQAYFTGGNTVNRGFDTELPGITDAVLKNAIYEALNGNTGWTDGIFRLYATLAQDFLYQDANRNVIFLDNHDMSRLYSMVNEDISKFKSGIALLLTMRGIPQLYYGTEILMKNHYNPPGLVRMDFPGGWPGDKADKFTASGRTALENEAFNFVRLLARYRKNSPALQRGKMMQYVPEDGIYTYFRYLPDGGKQVMVIVNADDKAKKLPTARFVERMANVSAATNVITSQKLENLKIIAVPAKTTLVLELN
ncbi:glycosidase [Pedobacter africanus]|uniref:Glycosidase n=1 Tax=Pedobacter africanus TaxID=151894 RepID=A0ACC6KYK6_9SPHI|nr:glycoside hydrolase family 13 protein [Pedobacter africanus]MDR6784208.1 glycosidase [Pedobacter africanus]